MQAYSILYSYPSWDANYRPQRGVRVIARSEQEACSKALQNAPQGSTIMRATLSRREATAQEIAEQDPYNAVREYDPLESTKRVMSRLTIAVASGADDVSLSADDLREIYAYVIGCNMEISDYRTIRYGKRAPR